jgi:prepilin-type N-terminal cleavage/methylation domain-containing protein
MPSRRRGVSGLTLIEMLTVITVFAMLLAFSIVFMQNANRDLGVAAGLGHVAGLLRIAQQHARTTAAPAWVVLDTTENAAHALLKETVGEWHLEDGTGFGAPAQVTGGTRVPGRVGQGILFAGSGTIQCGEVPVFAPNQGVAVELWYLRRPGRSRGVLARIGDQLELAAETDGRISGRVGTLQVHSDQVRLPADAWCWVQLVYSGRDLRLFLNRNPCGTTAGSTAWTPGPFQVGDARAGVSGIVDEIRLSLIVPQERFALAPECRFDFSPSFKVPPDGKVVLGFDAEGRLEPPPAPPFTFAVRSPADRRELTVQLSGALQQQHKDPEPPPKK